MKSSLKRKWFILIFSFLTAGALLFVWWMSSSDFESSYREIKQQYYGVVAGQVVNEIEASIKYGKKLDSFYDVGSIFGKLTTLLPSDMKAVITNNRGGILYTSFGNSADKNNYLAVLRNPQVTAKLQSLSGIRNYTALVQDKYEIMMLPITDKNQVVAGSFTLIYPAASIKEELMPEQLKNLRISFLVLGIAVLILIIFFCLVPFDNNAESPNDGKEKHNTAVKRRRALLMAPALIIMLAIGVQSSIMYNQYQMKYKSALTEGARGILTYIDHSIASLHQKGVPFEKMYGLSEYLTGKVKATPILWNIRVYNTIADTGEALKRANTWEISAPLATDGSSEKMQVEIQVSQAYMNGKMLNMLLEFLATLIVAAVVILEAMKLPDILIFRRSEEFNTGSPEQYEKITAGIRFLSFIVFMGIYASMPFSAILMRQWEARIFGLSTDLAAALPMTLELLAVMLFSLLFARFFQKTGPKKFIYSAGLLIILGNALCAIATGPFQIIFFRILCGIGFAGLKHVLNTVISLGSGGDERTGLNIAGLNAGLLGGIMCGGSIGAVIANSTGISLTYVFTAGLLLIFVIMILSTIPWKLLQENAQFGQAKEETASRGTLRALFNIKVLKYLLMVTLPLNIGLMFIVAFIPGYIQKMNMPVIVISYGYLLNGLAGIYLGSALAKILTKKLGRTVSVSVMLVMGGAGVLVIGFWSSAGIILFSTALMGLFDGFGSPAAMNYFIEMPEIKDNVGVLNSLAFLGVMGNATQMISPLGYGWLMLMSTVSGFNTLLILGAIYLVFAVAFLVPFRRHDHNRKLAV